MQYKVEYLWAMVGKFLPQFIYLITTMVLSRFLTTDDFGMIGVLAIYFTVANTLIDSGLGGSLVKEKEISELDCSTIFVFNLTLSLLLYFIIILFARRIELYYEVEGLSDIIRILCIIFIINAWGLVPQSLLVRDLRFRTKMFISIISVAFSAVIAIVMAIFDFGVWSLVAYQVVNSLVVTILSLYTTRYKVSFKFSIRSFKHLFSFGVFTTLATVIDTVYENIIVNFFGKNLSIQQAGLLYQAKRIEEVPTQSIATTVTNVSFPILTKLRFESSKFVVECSSIFKMVLLMILPLLACISFFSTPIIRLLFGDQWIDAGPYLNLLIFAGIFKIAETLNRTFIKSTTEVGRLFKFTIIKNVLGIGLLMIFARINVEYILYGYILASFLGYLVNCILLSQVSDWSIGDQFMLFIRIAFPTICFYLIMSLFAHFVSILFIQIIMAFISLSLLYLVLFRLYKINVFSVVKQFVR